MNKFDKIYEKFQSEVAKQAPHETNLRDDRIGNMYLILAKSGESYTVRVEKGDKPNTAKTQKSYTFNDETAARKKYYALRSSIIDKMGK